MDFMKLFGTVFAVLFDPGSASKINGQRICRQGTQRPCYKVSYIQDSQRRVTFEDASQACRLDGGELLSIETESEQRMIQSFIKQLQTGDGDFWIGLRRSPQHHRTGATRPGCPSQYYWLDGSKAKFRNWLWDEPSCDVEMCVVLYHQPSAPRDEGHFLFQWNDANCTSKNNFVCKYPEGKVPVFTQEGKTAHAVSTLRPDLSESSISASDNTLYVSYILYATIPALLLLLSAVAGFLGYKRHVKRRKTETETSPSRSKTWMSTTASTCPIQGPYAFSDVTKLHHPALDSGMSANGMNMYSCVPSQNTQCDYYENVSCSDRECGFVTNDIYETCRAQSRHCHSQTGWVENEIYG